MRLIGEALYEEHHYSNRQHDLDAHVLSLMHELPINDNLMHANTVVHSICGICSGSNLDFAPLAVGRHQFAL